MYTQLFLLVVSVLVALYFFRRSRSITRAETTRAIPTAMCGEYGAEFPCTWVYNVSEPCVNYCKYVGRSNCETVCGIKYITRIIEGYKGKANDKAWYAFNTCYSRGEGDEWQCGKKAAQNS